MDDEKLRGKIPNSKIQIQDFLVDVLGGLVPGTVLVGSVGLLALLMIIAILNLVDPSQNYALNTLLDSVAEITAPVSGIFWLGIFGAMISFAYVIGHLVYRRDPKQPNRRGFERISKGFTEENKKTEFACTTTDNCEFPFPFIKSYLKQRELTHLLPLVPWKDKISTRSKVYINILKIRLRFHHPDKIGPIVRNEAHVRLASSGWYASKYIKNVAIFSLIIIGLCFGASIPIKETSLRVSAASHLRLVFPAVVILVLAFTVKVQIERFIHYQRIREVIYVLETAYTAFRSTPELLVPPYESTEELAAAKTKPARLSRECKLRHLQIKRQR